MNMATSTVAKFANGTTKIKPISKHTLAWLPAKTEKVIGIDFGTSTLAVAYRAGVNSDVIGLKIQEETDDYYVPTVLLIKPDGRTMELGERALLQYTRLEVEVQECLFFQRVKLELQNDKLVSHKTTVEGSDGQKYYLIEIIGLILRAVLEKLKTYFSSRGGKYNVDDFHWVLTVPALWGERARDMMREAAYLAGLCSKSNKWNELLSLPLRPSHTHTLHSVKEYENHPERLSLVYEPDAAAAWCNNLTNEHVRTGEGIAGKITTENFFLTIDIGGGTIDVTGHQVLANGRMQRVNIPKGEVYGGTIVNEAFRTFLENDVVQDRGFKQYLRGQDKAENKAELHGLIYIHFERAKKLFAENNDKEAINIVQLPPSFAHTYRSKMEALNGSNGLNYKKKTYQLIVSSVRMKNFFEMNITKVHECITRAKDAIIQKYGDKFEVFYLVGGFGGCSLITDEVRNHYGCTGSKLKVVVPQDHDLSVVKGACIYYNKHIFTYADATYGVGCAIPFDSTNPVHARATPFYNEIGEKYADDLFQPYVQKDNRLNPNEIYVIEFVPRTSTEEIITFPVYSTIHSYLDFVNQDDKKKLKESASVTIDISKGMHLPWKNRRIDLAFDFNGIEILIYGHFRETGEQVNASMDFLSTFNKFELV